MTRKSSFIALVLFGSAICASAADPSSSDSDFRERGPWAALKRTWSGAVNGLETIGRGAKNSVKSVFSGAPVRKNSGLEVSLVLEPNPVSLATVRQLKVILRVYNRGKTTQLLSFPTSQRAEAVIRDQSDSIVVRSSEDRASRADSALLTINPGERLEFDLALSTGALSAGRSYTLDAAVTSQDGLRAKVPVKVIP